MEMLKLISNDLHSYATELLGSYATSNPCVKLCKTS